MGKSAAGAKQQTAFESPHPCVQGLTENRNVAQQGRGGKRASARGNNWGDGSIQEDLDDSEGLRGKSKKMWNAFVKMQDDD